MGQQPNVPLLERRDGIGNARDAAEIILRSRSTLHALELLNGHLSATKLNLLFLGAYDPDSKKECTVIFSEFPSYLQQMCTEFDGNQGCPLVQLAMKSREPFEALSLYLAGFDEFFSMRYLKELQNLGFEKINVVPIEVCDSVFIFFVGCSADSRYDASPQRLSEFLSQFSVGLSVKFNLKRLSHKRLRKSHKTSIGIELNAKEVRCLDWLANGKSTSEVAAKLKLSEHAVSKYTNNACAKLKANSRSHAIAIATRIGIIDRRGV